jgi:Tfp pilus assembly protein PilX
MYNPVTGGYLRRGGVLITALVFATIISLFALGVAVVATSHMSRSAVESDYATAIQLADAGINYELRHLSSDTSTAATRAHQAFPATGQPGAYTGSLTDIPGGGSFTVSVLNADGTGPWAPPNGLLIRSTGTINGISRTVEITGKSRGLFEDYAIFAITEGKVAGSTSTINGNVGANGPVYFSGGAAATNVNGELTYNGYPRVNPTEVLPGNNSGYESGNNVWWNPDPVQWPTVAEIAAQLFPGGLSYLATNNNNGRAMEFSVSDPNFTIANAVAVGVGTGNLNVQAFNDFTVDMNVEDADPSGNRYQDGDEGLYETKVMVLPPGDYYFNNLTLSNARNGPGILIDNASGMVRIWIDGGTGPNDSLDCPVMFTSTDKNKFRLYYNNCASLSINGNSTFHGSIYAYNSACARDTFPEIVVAGSSVINGSAIAARIDVHGNSTINFPNNGSGGALDDYVLWYGFFNTWREVTTNGGTLFPDGTSR